MAAITDVVDGWLARRMGLVTVIGKFLDPLADKLIVLAAMVMLVRLGRFPAWVAILLLSREFVVTGLRQIAASEGMVIAAGQEGKWKTALQLVGIIALLRALPARAGPVGVARSGELQRRGPGADLPERGVQPVERGRLLPGLPADARPARRRTAARRRREDRSGYRVVKRRAWCGGLEPDALAGEDPGLGEGVEAGIGTDAEERKSYGRAEGSPSPCALRSGMRTRVPPLAMK